MSPPVRLTTTHRLTVRACSIAPSAFDMPVDAVVTDVELSTDVPLRVRRLPLEELVPGLEPRDPLRLLAPEALQRAVVDIGLSVGLPAEIRRRGVAPLLDLHGF